MDELGQSSNTHLKMLLKVAAAANEASTIGAMQSTLDCVCELTGWPVGHGYLLDRAEGGQFVSTMIWNANLPSQFEPFRAGTEKSRLGLTEGLPGQVVAAGKPVRLMSLADPKVFPRSRYAVDVGLKFGFAFPVLIEEETVAVLEFFSPHRVQITDELESLLSQVGTLLGRAFERRRAAEKLRHSEERYRGLAETASDSIVTIDQGSRMLYVNPATERVFGYAVDELLGQEVTILMPNYLREIHRQALTRYSETGKKHMSWYRVELSALHKKGHEFPIELSLAESVLGTAKSFTGIVRDVTERKKAEQALKYLSAHLIRLQDEERRRIGRELHDSAGQYLAAASMNLSRIERTSLSPESSKALLDVGDSIQRCSSEIRTLSYLLHPPHLDEMGLVSAIPWYTEGFSQRSGIKVVLEMPEELGRLSPEIEIVIFRLLQESLTNIHRHSGSGVAKIRLTINSASITLEVQDEGRGIPPSTEPKYAARTGVGIAGMRERVQEMCGEFEISSDSRGTLLKASLPLASPLQPQVRAWSSSES